MVRLAVVLLSAAPLLAQGFTPSEAVKRMKLPPGFSVRAVATEPMIRQPLSISFDTRGRLWVLQYLQYPNPAGLKPVTRDKYLRTVWDKVPDAPPKGPKGLDRITICSDPDKNGVFTKSKDFVTGLNLASGFCLAPGGVYVVQPPYLLYYPDKNEDDVPDGDPEVLLTGFGMNDTHSMANSLQFGPDGWLYGAAGSTSTCKIKNPNDQKQPVIEFQQGVWRFHPKTKKFELFSEGGGNTYGLDFDRNGQCITGTNWGGFAMLHQMQGAYYVKGFSKHGPLHNPYAYGYFDHVSYKNFKGGHVTCGGILYEADAYPKEYRHQYIAGNLLSNAVYWHKMTPKGASFTAEHGGELLEANDSWFRPVDLQLGPDGCVYVADWYDKRAAHLDPVDNWDKTNGRVYKIEYTKGERRDVSPPVLDLRKKSNAELVDLLKNPNIWYRRQARELLGSRKVEPALIDKLRKQLADEKGTNALEALWTLNAVGGLDAKVVEQGLKHENPSVRAWTVRLAQEGGLYRKDVFAILTEHSPIVLAQYACTARRMTSNDSVGFGIALLGMQAIQDDPALPLLCWWALEGGTEHLTPPVLNSGVMNDIRRSGERREAVRFVLERLARKVAATSAKEMVNLVLEPKRYPLTYEACLRGFEQGLTDKSDKEFRGALVLAVITNDCPPRAQSLLTRLLIRLGDSGETWNVRQQLRNDRSTEKQRIEAMQLLSLVKSPELRVFVPTVLESSKSNAMLLAGIAAAEGFDDAKSAELMLAKYSTWPAAVKKRAVQALLSRPAWALELFQAWDAGKFPKADLTLDHGRTAVQLGDKALTAVVEKHFGKIAPATAGEKQARIAALNLNMSRSKPGDPMKGKVIFTKTCAACHQLHGEGTKIGPDLTTADRKNRMYMLMNIVDPSGYIRPEYLTHTVNTLDGRTVTGVVVEQSPESLTLASYVNGKVEKAVIARGDIDKLDPSPVSVMPEKLLDIMTDDQIRDLFAYLASDKPVAKSTPAKRPDGQKKKYKIALVSGSLEYKSDESLTAFAKMLEEKYPVECVKMYRKTDSDIPGVEKIGECDIAVFFTRRLAIDGTQLKAVKDYCASGKPVIGIRTASHGFQKWLDMDKDVFGGSYKGHFGAGLKCVITIPEKAKDHPVLKGFKPYASTASLYKNTGIARDATMLLVGEIPMHSEPLTWVRERDVNKGKQRVFYTSLGHPTDFQEAAFNRLLVNALGWCLKDEPTFAK